MAQIDEVYNYLQENYSQNVPIFLSEINIPGMKPVSLRPQLKKLTEDGRLKRFDTGIYYLPKKSVFRFASMLSTDEVIRKKYLLEGDCIFVPAESVKLQLHGRAQILNVSC